MTGRRGLVVNFSPLTPYLELSLEVALSEDRFPIDYAWVGDSIERCGHGIPRFWTIRKHALGIRSVERGLSLAEPLLKEKGGRIVVPDRNYRGNSRCKATAQGLLNGLESLDEIKGIKYNGYSIGYGIVSSVISNLRDSRPDCLANIETIKRYTMLAVQACQLAEDLFSGDEYGWVYLFNGRNAETNALRQVAEKSGIDVRYFECGGSIYRYFCEDYMPHDLAKRREELVRVCENADKKAIEEKGREFFASARRTRGMPNGLDYRKNQEEGFTAASKWINRGRDSGFKIITYFSSSDDEFESLSSGLDLFPEYGNQIGACERLIELSEELRFKLIVRIHPHLMVKSAAEYRRWVDGLKRNNSPNLYVVGPDEKDDSYELIYCSDMVVTSGSTIGIEAVACGKPVVSLCESLYTPPVEIAGNKDTLRLLVKELLELGTQREDSAYRYGYWSLNFGREFQFYKPITLWEGKFLETDLQDSRRKRMAYLLTGWIKRLTNTVSF